MILMSGEEETKTEEPLAEEKTEPVEPLAEEKTEPITPKSADDCPFCPGSMLEESSIDYRGYTEVIHKCNKCGFIATFRK